MQNDRTMSKQKTMSVRWVYMYLSRKFVIESNDNEVCEMGVYMSGMCDRVREDFVIEFVMESNDNELCEMGVYMSGTSDRVRDDSTIEFVTESNPNEVCGMGVYMSDMGWLRLVGCLKI